MKTLDEWISIYQSSAIHNDAIFSEFRINASSVPMLREHRDWVENNNWGFGDRAHHYMWFLILHHLVSKNITGRLLEVGVFKGQIISLWALISRELGRDFIIHAVSPFKGNRANPIFHILKKILFSDYRTQSKEGNLYKYANYLASNKKIFSNFKLDFSNIVIHQGFSHDENIQLEVSKNTYLVIYIDGDHSYEGCLNDILWLAPLIETDGFLVIDDASYFLPGQAFFKGHVAVSRACEIIPSLGFSNVLNIGHNRIFMKMK